MKKLRYFLPLAAALLFCVSCEKDDNTKDNQPNRPQEEHYTTVLKYKVQLNDTILHFFAVDVVYRGADSKTHAETIDSTCWSYEADSWGDSLGMRVNFRLREGVDTNYETAPYIRDKKIYTRMQFQALAGKYNADGSMKAVKGDLVPVLFAHLGIKLEKAYFAGVEKILNEDGDRESVSLK